MNVFIVIVYSLLESLLLLIDKISTNGIVSLLVQVTGVISQAEVGEILGATCHHQIRQGQ